MTHYSATASIAGVYFGPKASAVVRVLESLGRERNRSMGAGFVQDILLHTSMLPSDVNSVISSLLAAGLIRRRGKALIEVVLLDADQIRKLVI